MGTLISWFRMSLLVCQSTHHCPVSGSKIKICTCIVVTQLSDSHLGGKESEGASISPVMDMGKDWGCWINCWHHSYNTSTQLVTLINCVKWMMREIFNLQPSFSVPWTEGSSFFLLPPFVSLSQSSFIHVYAYSIYAWHKKVQPYCSFVFCFLCKYNSFTTNCPRYSRHLKHYFAYEFNNRVTHLVLFYFTGKSCSPIHWYTSLYIIHTSSFTCIWWRHSNLFCQDFK